MFNQLLIQCRLFYQYLKKFSFYITSISSFFSLIRSLSLIVKITSLLFFKNEINSRVSCLILLFILENQYHSRSIFLEFLDLLRVSQEHELYLRSILLLQVLIIPSLFPHPDFNYLLNFHSIIRFFQPL